ncbi:MAG: 1-(5-phosphoribosyl)-5-[(5-phosphoribosylamino)methylideneamino]imidazole-4-carboxamide isomerase [Gemmatimonadales bacterium]
MDLFPAIDIRSGRVVRLSQGETARETVYGNDPVAVAARFVEQGTAWIHLVDLDRAFGTGNNDELLRRIVSQVSPRVRVQLGGGFRSLDRIREACDLAVARVVVGTGAVVDPDFVPAAIELLGPARLAVGVDARDGWVAVRGWTETSPLRAEELARRVLGQGATTLIYTDVARDGLLGGPDIEGAVALQQLGAAVIASGGVASLDDIRAVRRAGLAGVVVGRALYEGAFGLPDALEAAGCAPHS